MGHRTLPIIAGECAEAMHAAANTRGEADCASQLVRPSLPPELEIGINRPSARDIAGPRPDAQLEASHDDLPQRYV